METTIPEYASKDKIRRILIETKEVIADSINTKNEKIKARWACGMLGLDPDNLTEAELLKFFRQQGELLAHTSPGPESVSKYFNLAKDILRSTFFDRR